MTTASDMLKFVIAGPPLLQLLPCLEDIFWATRSDEFCEVEVEAALVPANDADEYCCLSVKVLKA
nr:hypothetical protein Iba_chr06aCG16040 [Ipomoea batatas]